MKKNLLYIILLAITVLLSACKKDEKVKIASLSLENLELSVAYTTAEIKVDVCCNATINEVLLEYTVDSTFKECSEARMTKVEKTEQRYAVYLDSLLDGAKYYFRCKVLNKINSCFSQPNTFSTQQIVVPTMGSISITDISYTSATCVGEVISHGGDSITERGICLSTLENPTIDSSKVSSGKGVGSFTCKIIDLTAGTTYYVRAYATNKKGTVYSEQLSFTTPNYGMPTVTTSAATNISYTTATCGGNVTADGDQTVTARGVCYSTSQNPTISNSKVQSGSGKGSFTCNLTGLSAGTTYYVRAYATNNQGTSYGQQISFKTSTYGLPTVSTSVATNITYTSATCGGNVTADGGQTVTARGICYSTTQNPTISNSKVQNGSGKGSFTCNLTGLSTGTTYYVRAYATNSKGTSYGQQVSFKTTAYSLPTVTTSSVSNRTTTTATCGGNVTADGGQTVTARGICYSTSQNPTISNSKVQSGSGKGAFTCALTNLIEGETYYVRAYATNSRGTSYGSQVSFTTISTAFSTSPTNKVHFAPGNLQYNAMLGTHQCADGTTKQGTWRFADHQYDALGYANQNASSTYNGWIDLFSWGTSGYTKQPWELSYYDVKSNLIGNYAKGDWGVYNAISNGGNTPSLWRTLLFAEWRYIILTRNNASNLKSRATVNSIHGYILLPDLWELPQGISFTPLTNDWTANTYNSSQWSLMEANGAVFLPASGYRDPISLEVIYDGGAGLYWTATAGTGYDQVASAIFFNSKKTDPSISEWSKTYSCSVRLVQDINQ